VESGIERYVPSTVLDEADTCRFLDGTVIETSAGLRTFERLETSDDPLALERLRTVDARTVGEDGRRRLVAGGPETGWRSRRSSGAAWGPQRPRRLQPRAARGRPRPVGRRVPSVHHGRTTTVPA
jgi:hypothetical protein